MTTTESRQVAPSKTIECLHRVRRLNGSENDHYLLALSANEREISIVSHRNHLVETIALQAPVTNVAMNNSATWMLYRTDMGYGYARSINDCEEEEIFSFTDFLFCQESMFWGIRPFQRGVSIEKRERVAERWEISLALQGQADIINRKPQLVATHRDESVAITGRNRREMEICLVDATDPKRINVRNLMTHDSQFLPLFSPDGGELICVSRESIYRNRYPFSGTWEQSNWPGKLDDNTHYRINACYIDFVRILVMREPGRFYTFHTRSLQFEEAYSIEGYEAIYRRMDLDWATVTFRRLGDDIVFLFPTGDTTKLVVVPIDQFTPAF